jgi:hypothetical protein
MDKTRMDRRSRARQDGPRLEHRMPTKQLIPSERDRRVPRPCRGRVQLQAQADQGTTPRKEEPCARSAEKKEVKHVEITIEVHTGYKCARMGCDWMRQFFVWNHKGGRIHGARHCGAA